MPEAESWTIGRLLTWTTDYLKRHGSESPRLEAEVLLAHARGCQRIQLYTAFDDVVPDDVRATFRGFVQRRAAGEPVAYMVGHREFYSLPFRVQPGVLIPRPETEHLVVEVLDRIKQRAPGCGRPLIADVGTGSGAIAVALAKHAPTCRMVAIDLSPQALDVARANVDSHGVADRVELLPSDLLAGCRPTSGCDIVVSNPPYVSEAGMATSCRRPSGLRAARRPGRRSDRLRNDRPAGSASRRSGSSPAAGCCWKSVPCWNPPFASAWRPTGISSPCDPQRPLRPAAP